MVEVGMPHNMANRSSMPPIGLRQMTGVLAVHGAAS